MLVDVNMFNVERSESVIIYLNKESRDKARIVTNNSSLVSVGIPKYPWNTHDEKPIIEQFVTSFNKETGELETEEPSIRKHLISLLASVSEEQEDECADIFKDWM